MVILRFTLICLLFLNACGDAKKSEEPQGPITKDYSTPSKTLETFVEATNRWDTKLMGECFESYPEYMQDYIERHSNEFKVLYKNASCKILDSSDSSAHFIISDKDVGGLMTLTEAGEWKLVTYKNPYVNPFN